MQMEAEKSADTANVAAGVAGTAANIAATLDSGGGSSKAPKRPDVTSPTDTDMANLDAKVGVVHLIQFTSFHKFFRVIGF
jgi:hypothetical protein